MSSDRSLWDLVRSFELSSYRENLFEQIFCSEFLQGCWLAGLPPIEIDRPFVDFQGYDLVATCAGITRHIQLKASRGGQIAVHRNLGLKPSACVVNLGLRQPRNQKSSPAPRYRFVDCHGDSNGETRCNDVNSSIWAAATVHRSKGPHSGATSRARSSGGLGDRLQGCRYRCRSYRVGPVGCQDGSERSVRDRL